MTIITKEEIAESGIITPANSLAWVKEAFALKEGARLPSKISIKYGDGYFMNTMPCMIPQLGVFGVKVVNRFPDHSPAISGDIMLYNSDGEIIALMDATEITSSRTGAVAALAVKTFARAGFEELGIMGLGETGWHTLACLRELYADRAMTLHLLKYKNHAETAMQRIQDWDTNWRVDAVDSIDGLVSASDVVVSCITYAPQPLASDNSFRPGCLVVPVHTRGFQNCDLFFDKVFADDTAHVSGFKYFSSFRKFAEMPDVLAGKVPGRESEDERILSYNIGIALHDMVFAHHVSEGYGAIN